MKTKRGAMYLRRAAFSALIVLVCTAAGLRGLPEALSLALSMLPAALTVCISMHERSMASMCFGLFAGFLWDSVSVTPDGFFALVLAVTGFFCSVLVTFKLRRNIRACMLLSFFSLLFCAVLYWLVFCLFMGSPEAGGLFLSRYLAAAAGSLALTPLMYAAVRLIFELTESKTGRIDY